MSVSTTRCVGLRRVVRHDFLPGPLRRLPDNACPADLRRRVRSRRPLL